MNPRLSTPHAVEDDRLGLTDRGELQTVSSSEHSHAMEHARLLWASRVLLGKALLVGLMAGTLIALLIPSRYESTLQLMPPDNQSSSGMAMLATLAAKSVAQSAGGAGAIAGDLLGVKSSGSLFIGILRSRTVEDRLVRRFQLKSVYRMKLDEDARKELQQNSGVSEDRKSGILTLTVNDRDRQRARAMATAYAEELNRLVAELSTSAARRERVFLEERLAAVKQDLDQASRDLGDFSSKNATLDMKDQGRAMVEAAATLQGELIAAEAQRRGLEAIYTSNNVRVRAAEARAAELRTQLEKLGGKERDGDSEGDQGDSLYPSLRKLPILGVKYAELYRRAKIQEVLYETLTQQYEIAKVQEAKEIPSVKILDDASLPERHSFPPRMLITFLCGCAALLFVSMWIVARHRWESTASHDPRKQFAQEVFHGVNSIMPWVTPNGSRWQAASHRVWVRLVKGDRQDPGANI
jgi:uncharacterized protein involved in exopolysaccharide biosynthesis